MAALLKRNLAASKEQDWATAEKLATQMIELDAK
jgi:hypothetical protein